MDFTGRLHYFPIRVNGYMLITYEYDADSNVDCPVQNIQEATLNKARKKLHQQFWESVIAPNI